MRKPRRRSLTPVSECRWVERREGGRGRRIIIRTLQEVLLLLLSDNDDLRQRLDQEAAERKKETADLRERLDRETADLKDKLDREVAERKVSGCIIRLKQIESF